MMVMIKIYWSKPFAIWCSRNNLTKWVCVTQRCSLIPSARKTLLHSLFRNKNNIFTLQTFIANSRPKYSIWLILTVSTYADLHYIHSIPNTFESLCTAISTIRDTDVSRATFFDLTFLRYKYTITLCRIRIEVNSSQRIGYKALRIIMLKGLHSWPREACRITIGSIAPWSRAWGKIVLQGIFKGAIEDVDRGVAGNVSARFDPVPSRPLLKRGNQGVTDNDVAATQRDVRGHVAGELVAEEIWVASLGTGEDPSSSDI